MAPRIDWDKENREEQVVDEHLHNFAIAGLRTLVMGKWELEEDEVESLLKDVEVIEAKGGPAKDDDLMDEYDKYEIDLTFVGASAIEDKLQEYVPETIATLMRAEIWVWVLTGDK